MHADFHRQSLPQTRQGVLTASVKRYLSGLPAVPEYSHCLKTLGNMFYSVYLLTKFVNSINSWMRRRLIITNAA